MVTARFLSAAEPITSCNWWASTTKRTAGPNETLVFRIKGPDYGDGFSSSIGFSRAEHWLR